MLQTVTEKTEVQKAYKLYYDHMIKKGQKVRKWITWPGESIEADVFWHPELHIWAHFNSEAIDNRYWCIFGDRHIDDFSMMNISCEVNPPFDGYDRRIQGAFLKDSSGKYYVAHKGLFRGRRNISAKQFRSHYRGSKSETIVWPNGNESELTVIGCLNDRDFPKQMKHFVNEVERIKRHLHSDEQTEELEVKTTDVDFTPEFEGQKEAYRTSDIVRSECNHGPVINMLAEILKKNGCKVGNDGARDLFILGRGSKMKVLFEAKTSLDPGSIYKGIGQLMLNGAHQKQPPRRVLVVPGAPKPQTAKTLKKLDIEILEYKLGKNGVEFYDLDRFR